MVNSGKEWDFIDDSWTCNKCGALNAAYNIKCGNCEKERE